MHSQPGLVFEANEQHSQEYTEGFVFVPKQHEKTHRCYSEHIIHYPSHICNKIYSKAVVLNQRAWACKLPEEPQ